MFRLFRKRNVWLPTWQLLAIVATACLIFAWFVVANIHPFLSPTEPAPGARVLVVEGWVSDRILEQQFEGFQVGQPYDYVCTSGATLDPGYYLSEYRTYADLAAKSIEAIGVPPERIVPAPSKLTKRDRTFHAALSLKQKLISSEIPALRDARAIDVLSSGTHGRRTRAVFRKVLGDDIEVGIISGDPGTYDTKRWFTSSQGAKTVIIETISLIYEWLNLAKR